MAENFVEVPMGEYYRMQGYFVMQNYWFDFQTTRTRKQRGNSHEYRARSWSDIDVLACNDSELRIVQIRPIINERKKSIEIVNYFDRVEEYLKRAGGDRSDPVPQYIQGNSRIR